MDKNKLEKICTDLGADLFGVADISLIKNEFILDKNVIKDMNRAISLGVRLSAFVLADIKDEPTRLYYHHYRAANIFIDQLSFRLANIIQNNGFAALPIAASQTFDQYVESAHLSHKLVGVLAGLGWIGRNNLLVNGRLGSHSRLATILTDLELEPDAASNGNCGQCRACILACPAGAIKENPGDFNGQACLEKLKEFKKKRIVNQFVCGICVKACTPAISNPPESK